MRKKKNIPEREIANIMTQGAILTTAKVVAYRINKNR